MDSKCVSTPSLSTHCLCRRRPFVTVILLLAVLAVVHAYGSEADYDLDKSRIVDAGDLFQVIRSFKDATLTADFNNDARTDWADLFLLSTAGWGKRIGYGDKLPSDPEDIAPPGDDTVPSDLYEDTEFIYSGTDPIQIYMDPDTIEPTRVAVLRGRVRVRDGTWESGVEITILDHPEYGITVSRADGLFDMAVNGGGLLTVNYRKEGFLPAQRQIRVPWRDYAWLPEIALVPLDPVVTTIDFSEPIEVAQGSVISDEDGQRQATLLFSQGTRAAMVLPSGATQPLSSLSVRATEYTVGPDGPASMPAELPPTSGYTYCVELSADEALGAGAVDVRFDRPVYTYLENFLNFPVGGAVPTGYYDRQQGQWVASENGRVIEILSESGGRVELDIAGNGIAATPEALAALDISDIERERLAALYEPGDSLWRVPIQHFTPWDCNWPYGPPLDAVSPNHQPPSVDQLEDEGCSGGGSVIEYLNQVLGERLPIAGTPFTLNYRSDRVRGRTAGRTLDIPLSGGSVPESLASIGLQIEIAGRQIWRSFAPLPNQSTQFIWDGLDAYGRTLQGNRPVSVRTEFVYPPVYYPVRADFVQSFARSSPSTEIVPSRATSSISFMRNWKGFLTTTDISKQGFGGWTLNIHHTYDPDSRTLYLGDGGRRRAETTAGIINTLAGGFDCRRSPYGWYCGDWGPATEASLHNPYAVAFAPDGTFYIADSGNHVIRHVDSQGIITTVAGTGGRFDYSLNRRVGGYNGDEGPALEMELNYPTDIAVAPDGSFYIADRNNNRIRKVTPDGYLTTIAGTGDPSTYAEFGGDGGPATEAFLSVPWSIALAPDGSLYISDSGNRRVRRVGPDGIITTVAGGGSDYCNNGAPATEAYLQSPKGIALAPDGSLYICDYSWVRKVSPAGIISTVVGICGNTYNRPLGDGGPASQAYVRPVGLAVSPDGVLYIGDGANHHVRRVGTDGIITSIAGTGGNNYYNDGGFSGDGGPAAAAQVKYPYGVAVAPDGSLYVADSANNRIRRIGPPLPGFTYHEFILPSEDGKELYAFDRKGRHLQTLHGLSGAMIYRFIYDDEGLLVEIEDGDGHTTTIERDASGNPLAIVGRFGHRTELATGADGYLEAFSNPEGDTHQFTYTADGLLTSLTDPRGSRWQFEYDELGRLIRDEDPSGGYQTLARAAEGRIRSVTHTTALGRTTVYAAQELTTGSKRLTSRLCCGVQAQTTVNPDGSRTSALANGMVTKLRLGPDPRFEMQSPVPESLTLTTPGGLTYTLTGEQTATLSDPTNSLSPELLSESTTLNGKTTTRTYNAVIGQATTTTPEGRQKMTFLDQEGRIARRKRGSLEVAYIYDTAGRLGGITYGDGTETREFVLGYNPAGQVHTITDPLSRTLTLEYDSAGRILRRILPAGERIEYTYDANGLIASITPPGRPPHTFSYSPTGLLEACQPPSISAATSTTHYHYNLDGQLIGITRPGGATMELSYDTQGRLQGIAHMLGTVEYQYEEDTGQLSGLTTGSSESLSFTRDGSLLTETAWNGTVEGSVQRVYDKNFRMVSQGINSQHSVEFIYDGDGLLLRAGELQIQRDLQTGLVSRWNLRDITGELAHNSFGELLQYRVYSPAGDLYQAQYERDSIGRVISLEETLEGNTTDRSYAYDIAGRLSSVTENDSLPTSIAYDANGNRLTLSSPQGEVSASYDEQDRLLQQGSRTYEFSAAGDLERITDSSNGGATQYQYDSLGNLVEVNLPDGTQIEYVVDGLGRRVGKKVNGALAQGFLYQDRLNPVAELDAQGQVISRFVYAGWGNVPAYLEKAGTLYAILSDPLGSPRLVVEATSGAIVQRLDYDSFGKVLLDSNPGFQPFGFAGGLYDTHTQLVRFGARDYEPQSGRWTATDPMGLAAGKNLYRYAGADPVNRTDPTGGLTQMEIIDRIVELVSTDPEFQRRTESSLGGGILSDLGLAGGFRNVPLFLCDSLHEKSAFNAFCPAKEDISNLVCGGIAERAIEVIQGYMELGMLEGVARVWEESRDFPWDHYAVGVQTEDGEFIVLDWHATLDPANPEITNWVDW